MNYLKTKISIALISIFIIACNQQAKDIHTQTIPIEFTKDKILPTNECILGFDTLRLNAGSNTFIGQIKDIAITDSLIFIIDHTQTLFSFGLKDGVIRTKIQNIGKAKSEYIGVDAITSDENYLYVLDSYGRNVLYFDYQLSFIKKISLSFYALDFARVSNGFLFYNHFANEKLNHFVHTNLTGHILNSYVSPELKANDLMTSHYFTQDSYGNTYMYEALGNTIYEWNDYFVNSFYSIDYPLINSVTSQYELDNDIDGNKLFPSENFITSKYIICSFLCDGMRYYNFYDRVNHNSVNGMVKMNYNIPFFPQWQYKNSLIGIMEKNNSNMSNNDTFENAVYLIFYHVKI